MNSISHSSKLLPAIPLSQVVCIHAALPQVSLGECGLRYSYREVQSSGH